MIVFTAIRNIVLLKRNQPIVIRFLGKANVFEAE